MSFLSKLFDVMFPPSNTSNFDSATNLSDTGSDGNEIMVINPATAMPMVGGVGGIDLMGNLWGQSDSMGSGGSCFSTGGSSGSFDSGSMLDDGSTSYSCSMFD